MTCRDLIDLLDAYLVREIPGERLLVCERHLVICASCRAYLDSYRRTIALGKAAFEESDLPEDLARALLALRPRG